MIPLPFALYGLVGALLACIGMWLAGDAHGHKSEHTTMQAKIDETIIAAQKVASDNENHQRKENEVIASSFAASSVAVSVAASGISTRLRVQPCSRSDVPATAASGQVADGTGTRRNGADDGAINLDDAAREIVRLGAERDRLAAKVNGLEESIRKQPGYTDGN